VKIIREHSKFRSIWDSFILGLIFITCGFLPFQLAFHQDFFLQDRKIVYLIDLFFWIDIGFNFFTSYRFKGEEIKDINKIKNHYLKGFFLVDFLANFPFDVFFLFTPDIFIGKINLLLILRILRLVRVIRLYLIFNRWENYTRINPGYLRITKLFISVIIITHWIACIWFFFAFIDDFPEDSWVVTLGIKNSSATRQYIYSLYWAVTTMTTIGYGDITPNRDIEYILSTIIMVLGASIYAFIIGNIASLFSNLDSAKIAYKNKLEAVTQFLAYHQVPADLIFQLRNYYDYLWESHRNLKEENFFADLPLHFRLEILENITKDLIEKVPLFKYSSPSLRNVLLISLKSQTYSPNSYIVREGDVGQAIYFISLGEVEVLSENESNFECTLGAGEYFGHLSLIFNEKLTASVRTLTYCEIFILSKEQFNYIKTEYEEFKDVLKKVGSENTEKMSNLVLEGLII
jgi:hypothetical protein